MERFIGMNIKNFKEVNRKEVRVFESSCSIDSQIYDILLKVNYKNGELQNYTIDTKESSYEWEDLYRGKIKPAIEAKLTGIAMGVIQEIDESYNIPKKGDGLI